MRDASALSPSRRGPAALALGCLAGLGATCLCTAAGWLFRGRGDTSFFLVLYLFGVMGVALRWGRLGAAFTAVTSMVAFDYFFVDSLQAPRFTLHVHLHNLVVFSGMLLVAQVVAGLVHRLRGQAQAALDRERETAALYALNRVLARHAASLELLEAARTHLAAELGPGLDLRLGGEARGASLPLLGTRGLLGWMDLPDGRRDEAARPFLETCATQVALALERCLLAEEAERSRLHAESEAARSALLSSVSHDLRTPLAAIHGAAATLAQEGEALEAGERQELADMILAESARLDHLVGNLLDLTRLEQARVQPVKEWQPLEEVVGAVLTRLESRLGDLPVGVELPPDLPPVPLDGVLADQLFTNLLENALAHAPGSPVRLRAEAGAEGLLVAVEDQGPGVPEALRELVFEKFYRAPGAGGDGGVGLGLAICRAIVQAHGGRIWIEATPGGGAAFRFTLPFNGPVPEAL